MSTPISFFTTLSQDEISCIVPYVKTETLISFLSSKCVLSPFVHIAPRLFETLCIHRHNRIFFDFESATLKIGCCYRDVSVIENILAACGTVFKKLILYKVERFDGIDHFAARFSKYIIPSPESAVEIRTKNSVFSSSINASNCVTYINDGEFINNFSKSITHLKDMSLLGKEHRFNSTDLNMPTLKALNYRGEQLEKLEHLWKSVGASLEEVDLIVYRNEGWKNCINLMNSHCRKLNKIRLGNPLLDAEVSESDLADLLCSYGNQLLEASSHGFEVENSQRIVSECANVRFCVWNSNNEFDDIRNYDNRVDLINLVLKLEDLHDWTELSDTMKSCPSLAELIVHSHLTEVTLDEERIEAIFPARMDHLESLMFNIRINTHCLFRIANVTSNLRTLNVKLSFSNSAESLEAICRKNRHLELIKIMQHDAEFGDEDSFMETEDLVREFVHAVRHCHSLREFTVNFHERMPPGERELHDACVILRNRAISFFFRFNRCHFYRTRFGQCKFIDRGSI